jgi:hypothetical protein
MCKSNEGHLLPVEIWVKQMSGPKSLNSRIVGKPNLMA